MNPANRVLVQFGVLSFKLSAQINRSLFTYSYLKIKTNKKWFLKLEENEIKAFEEKVHLCGTEILPFDKINAYFHSVPTEDSKDIAISTIKDPKRNVSEKYQILSKYIDVCYSQKDPINAQEIYVLGQGHNSKNLQLNFLTLLFENQQFNEVIRTFEGIKNPNYNEYLLVMASFYCIETEKSLSMALKLYDESSLTFPGINRSMEFIAGLATKLEKHGLVIDILEGAIRYRARTNLFNLLYLSYLKVGDFDSFFDKFSESLKNPKRNAKLFICAEVSKCIEELKHSNEEFKAKFESITNGFEEDMVNTEVALFDELLLRKIPPRGANDYKVVDAKSKGKSFDKYSNFE